MGGEAECGVPPISSTSMSMNDPLRASGRFFRVAGEKMFLKMVVYGPFPDSESVDGTWLPQRDEVARAFAQIAAHGFNAVRICEVPPLWVADEARAHGLRIWFGDEWSRHFDFVGQRPGREGILRDARSRLIEATRKFRDHTGVGGVLVSNEVPAEMVRWIGWREVRRALEEMIEAAKEVDGDRLFAYGNYPPTKWITPRNADVVAFNIYLECREDFARLLPHLHLLAGDRPLLISEFGVNIPDAGEAMQREVFEWSFREAHGSRAGGLCWFTWSASWRKQDGTAHDFWDFGLVTRDDEERPALLASRDILESLHGHADVRERDAVAVVVCTRNGAARIAVCVDSLLASRHPIDEIVVVDDGSTDSTTEIVNGYAARGVKLLSIAPSGLSMSRNLGAAATTAKWIAYTDDDCVVDEDWIAELLDAAGHHQWDAVGGPNITPVREDEANPAKTVVDHAVGTASAVLLDDLRAEHLPGCNMMISRAAFDAVGGFRVNYQTAGDDVDMCWQLLDAGFVLGYQSSAMVWHQRRASIRGYLKQQIGYGLAESLLAKDWPARMTDDGARWQGVLYPAVGLPRDPWGIYGSAFGLAGYPELLSAPAHADDPDWRGQRLILKTLPIIWRWIGTAVYRLQPYVRAYGRWRGGMAWRLPVIRFDWARALVRSPTVIERWFDLSENGPTREELIREIERLFTGLGADVRADDGRREWDLEITRGVQVGSPAIIHVLTVMEYDGNNHCQHFGIRLRGGDSRAVHDVANLIADTVSALTARR